MADQNKIVVPGKVQKNTNRKFRIRKAKESEVEVDIEVLEDGEYEVEKFSIEGLPAAMNDGTPIRWFNNFGIKKNGQYIRQRFKVTIPGISNMGKSRLVIFDGSGDPYYYKGAIVNDTFELANGDPATGGAP